MTDTSTATDPGPTAPGPAPVANATPEPEPEAPRPDREAAKYRRQLRDTEAERDALAAQVAAGNIATVEAALTGKLAHAPEVFWRMVNAEDLASTVDEAGNIDPDKLAAVVDDVLDVLAPLGAKGAVGPYVATEGTGAGHTDGGPTWSDALRGIR